MVNPVSRTVRVAGVLVPSFFYGTAWKEGRTRELTTLALSAGFVAIDTANQRRHYVEAAVGEAVADQSSLGVVARAGLFLQTKFTFARGQDHRLPYDPAATLAIQVAQSCASSLEHLGTSYIDSYLLHGPFTGSGLVAEDWEVWRAMEALAGAGTIRLLGVSNVDSDQLAALHEGAEIKPAFVQNRCYARTGWDAQVREVCRARGIAYQGFSLLTANRQELSTPAVARIVARTGRTLPQVVFRFALQSGIIPLTGTSSLEHMCDDLASFDFDLSPADLSALETCARPKLREPAKR
jgi:diketogulonate reductase-like aldo/keto reductase